MRLRTTLSLAGLAVGAAVIGLGTLVVLGFALWMVGCLLLSGLIFSVIDLVVDPGVKVFAAVLLLGAALAALMVNSRADDVRDVVRQGRARLLRETVPIDLAPVDTEQVTSATARLAAQFDLPTPQLRHHHATTPIACTTEQDGETVLVVSSGLLAALPDAELEAVLARLLLSSSTLGVGLFSRGREFAADRAAVATTGEPGALAAALERLDSATADRPPEDLRTHARSVDAMSVLPTLVPERDGGGGLFAPHLATERRLERLRRLAAD